MALVRENRDLAGLGMLECVGDRFLDDAVGSCFDFPAEPAIDPGMNEADVNSGPFGVSCCVPTECRSEPEVIQHWRSQVMGQAADPFCQFLHGNLRIVHHASGSTGRSGSQRLAEQGQRRADLVMKVAR
jgi:hypothetical protein